MCLWHICPLKQDDTENQTDWYQEIQWTSFASDANLQPYKIRVTRLFGLIDIEFCEVYCKLISMSPNWLVIRIYSGQTNWCKQRYSQLRLHQMQTDSLKKFELRDYWLIYDELCEVYCSSSKQTNWCRIDTVNFVCIRCRLTAWRNSSYTIIDLIDDELCEVYCSTSKPTNWCRKATVNFVCIRCKLTTRSNSSYTILY